MFLHHDALFSILTCEAILATRSSLLHLQEAPARGRLEGTRDFTDKPTYRRWHDFEKTDPYSIQN